MPLKTMWNQAAKDYMAGYVAGAGTGVFMICIPFKDIMTYGWARLTFGTLGLGMMIYGWYYISSTRKKPEDSRIEAEPTSTTP